jgi:hypothetical protein
MIVVELVMNVWTLRIRVKELAVNRNNRLN